MKNIFPEAVKRPLRTQLHRVLSLKKQALLQAKKAKQKISVQKYLDSHSIVKVCLGAGKHAKPGWLNTDYEPFGHPDIVYLDATDIFPFSNQSVDYFYSEHMIEHLPLSSAQSMLQECYRTLRSGGKIRIATPDMMQLARLLSSSEARDVAEYAKWALQAFPPPVYSTTERTSCMVFNNFMRDWGHQFVYDEKTLVALLKDAGFRSIRRYAVNASDDPELSGQEMHQLITGDVSNNFETMVLEASK